MNTEVKSSSYLGKKALIHIVCISLVALSILPIWIMLVNATRSTTAIQQGISLIPSRFLSYNWSKLMDKGFNPIIGTFNSTFITFTATALSVYVSTLTAYGISNYNFKFKKPLYMFIIGIIMIPTQMSMIGFYQFMLKLNLTNSYIPLILPAIVSPSTVFFMKQFITGNMPFEIIEAGRIDGANEFKIFNIMAIPIMKPAIATMSIFSIVGTWNDFFTPLIFLTDQKKYTLPLMVQLLKGDIYRTEYGGIYLGLALTMIPLLIVYAFLSKYIIAGVAMGSVKG